MLDLERSLYSNNTTTSDNHIFICGLARAGTTILMRTIYGTGEFASLTYRDMPFVMMPNLWNKVSGLGKKHINESERAHGDGIKVNYDSPEALEEVFWRTHTGSTYINPDRLSRYDVETEIIELFKEYVQLINLRYEKKRYLSKNNNNILRINSILRAYSDSFIVIPFRDPVAQSASLLRQHIKFSELHKLDEFSHKYMNWLVHHEFGIDHRKFDFSTGLPEVVYSDSLTLDYWLQQWLNVYKNLINNHSDQDRVYFVCYEDLCSEQTGKIVWEQLSSKLNIDTSASDFRNANTSVANTDDKNLTNAAFDVYRQMKSLSSEKLSYQVN
jgi:hypothetical protein